MTDIRAAARQRLAEGQLYIDIEGKPLIPDQLRPEQVDHFYHLLALRALGAHYRALAEAVRALLDADPKVTSSTGMLVFAAMRRAADIPTLAQFHSARNGTEVLIKGLQDPELAALCGQILDANEQHLLYQLAFNQGTVWVCEKAVKAFGDVQASGTATFRRLQPVMQLLMGRPAASQIDQAIDDVEAIQDQFDELLERFTAYGQALGMEPDQQPNPRVALNQPENEKKIARFDLYMSKCLPDHPDEVSQLREALLRCAGILQTVITAMTQVDQRFEMLGVTA